jgi:hypothetical protein
MLMAFNILLASDQLTISPSGYLMQATLLSLFSRSTGAMIGFCGILDIE